jgi:hypothetical protein
MGVLSTILQRLRETGTTSVEKLYARILYLFPVRFTVSPSSRCAAYSGNSPALACGQFSTLVLKHGGRKQLASIVKGVVVGERRGSTTRKSSLLV